MKRPTALRPQIGVDTFLPKEHADDIVTEIELIRSTPDKKAQQGRNVRTFQQLRNPLSLRAGKAGGEAAGEVGSVSGVAAGEGRGEGGFASDPLGHLQKTARDWKNVFAALIETVTTHSLGQVGHALYKEGGKCWGDIVFVDTFQRCSSGPYGYDFRRCGNSLR